MTAKIKPYKAIAGDYVVNLTASTKEADGKARYGYWSKHPPSGVSPAAIILAVIAGVRRPFGIMGEGDKMDTNKVIIKTENLTKEYGQVTAVKKLNLKIKEGEIFGLLGPNGAGKTTTILMLMGLTEPTAGRALVAGRNVLWEPLEVKRIIGYLPDNVGFYEELTGRENLQYTARLNGISSSKAEKE